MLPGRNLRPSLWDWNGTTFIVTLRFMTLPDPPARALTQKSSISLVFVLSLGAMLAALDQAGITIITLIGRLNDRASGVEYTWNTTAPIREVAGTAPDGAPSVVVGTTSAITQMTGTVKDLPVSTLVLDGASGLVSAMTIFGVALCVFILVRTIGSGAPFARACSRALIALAIVVFVGFEGASVLQVVSEISQPHIAFSEPAFEGTFIGNGYGASVPFWPIYVAVVLAALAAVFRTGARYQNDSSGLV